MLTSEEIRGFMLDDGIVDGVHVKKDPSAFANNGAKVLRSHAQDKPGATQGEPRVEHGSEASDRNDV